MAAVKSILSSVSYASVALVVLCVAVSAQTSGDYVKPTFCKTNECPRYRVISTTDDFEVREYEPSKWVSVTKQDGFMVGMSSFMSLFRYIRGANANDEKIDMTVPVTKKMSGDKITTSFFVSSSVSPVPEPTADDVFLQSLGTQRVYVRSFGGRASKQDYKDEKDILAAALPAGRFDPDVYYTAGYDAPWTVFNRHNEVWFLAQ